MTQELITRAHEIGDAAERFSQATKEVTERRKEYDRAHQLLIAAESRRDRAAADFMKEVFKEAEKP